MFEQLQTWWQNATPDMHVALWEGGLMLGALVGGLFLGSIVTRILRAKNFDAVLRLPGSSLAPEPGRGFTPTFVAGLLVRLSIWGTAARWLAREHGWIDFANTLGLIIKNAWAVATVLVAALALGSLLAGRIIDYLKMGTEGVASRNGSAAPHRGVAGAVGAAVYGLVVLLALLLAADYCNWELARKTAQTLWDFAQHLLVAGGALLIGCIGAGWARDLVTLDGVTSPEKRAGQYTGLGIMAATTVLAVGVLLSSASVFFGLATLAILGFGLWLVRGHLPDIAAGLQLRAHQVGEVWFDGAPWQVSEVGLLTSEVGRAGKCTRVQNRLVMEARMHGAPAEANRR